MSTLLGRKGGPPIAPRSSRRIGAITGIVPNCLLAWIGGEIGLEAMMSRRDCVQFITDAAIAYFLPAFLVGSVAERLADDCSWDITDYTLLAIERFVKSESGKAETRNSAQLSTIRDYLAWLDAGCNTPESRAAVARVAALVATV